MSRKLERNRCQKRYVLGYVKVRTPFKKSDCDVVAGRQQHIVACYCAEAVASMESGRPKMLGCKPNVDVLKVRV
jgi:hypothetical protein